MGEGEMGKAWASCCGGTVLLTGVGLARWKAWPAVEKCLLKFSIVVDLLVVTEFHIPGAVQWYAKHLLAVFPSLCSPTHLKQSQLGDFGGQII